jgi:hypothetical protein
VCHTDLMLQNMKESDRLEPKRRWNIKMDLKKQEDRACIGFI